VSQCRICLITQEQIVMADLLTMNEGRACPFVPFAFGHDDRPVRP
jgi:hypothetical protein